MTEPNGEADTQADAQTTAAWKARQERRRSNVRINVTYLMTVLYATAALLLIIWFLAKGELEEALAVFTSVASISGGIIGFWFGNRASEKNFLPPKELVALVKGDAPPPTVGPAAAPDKPAIKDVKPATLKADGNTQEVMVTGSGFTKGAVAKAGDGNLMTAWKSESQLQVIVGGDLLKKPGELHLVVATEAGAQSEPFTVSVR